jgi:hypothetical protein
MQVLWLRTTNAPASYFSNSTLNASSTYSQVAVSASQGNEVWEKHLNEPARQAWQSLQIEWKGTR